MCLMTLKATYDPPIQPEEKYGWKVFDVEHGNMHFMYIPFNSSYVVPQGHWLQARGDRAIKVGLSPTIPFELRPTYTPGFHIYRNLDQALKYKGVAIDGAVVPVKYKNVVAEGGEGPFGEDEVVVAKEMYSDDRDGAGSAGDLERYRQNRCNQLQRRRRIAALSPEDLEFIGYLWRSNRLMLIVSELAEALEGLRHRNLSGEPGTGGYFEELADAQIRLLDNFASEGVSPEEIVDAKMVYNAKRSKMHGGKVA